MADNKTSKIVLEREYNVPLRRKWLLVPKYKRAKKAVATLRDFIAKHMKSEDVKLGRYLNMAIWEDGIKNPPHHALVIAKKNEEGVVTVELKAAPATKVKEEVKAETKKTTKKTATKKEETKVVDAQVVEKVEEAVETKTTEETEIAKEEKEE